MTEFLHGWLALLERSVLDVTAFGEQVPFWFSVKGVKTHPATFYFGATTGLQGKSGVWRGEDLCEMFQDLRVCDGISVCLMSRLASAKVCLRAKTFCDTALCLACSMMPR